MRTDHHDQPEKKKADENLAKVDFARAKTVIKILYSSIYQRIKKLVASNVYYVQYGTVSGLYPPPRDLVFINDIITRT